MIAMTASEIISLAIMLMFYAIPVAVAIWAVVILRRIRLESEEIRKTLDSIEQLIQQNPPV